MFSRKIYIRLLVVFRVLNVETENESQPITYLNLSVPVDRCPEEVSPAFVAAPPNDQPSLVAITC